MINSKLIGSTLIFAGTCIGAGMLALPLSASGPGFLISVGLLCLAAFVSTWTSLLFLEALDKTPEDVQNFSSLSRYTLGPIGQFICVLACFTLLFSLSCAYVSGGTSLIYASIEEFGFHFSKSTISAFYVLFVGSIVLSGHKTVDWLNRCLFSLKGICFIILIALLLPGIKAPLLTDVKNSTPYVWSAIPVLFFSFGLQIVVPTIYHYLDENVKLTRKAIIIGSILPCVVYILWLAVTLGVLPRYGERSYSTFFSQFNANQIGDFFLYIYRGYSWIDIVTNLFAHIAIGTSYCTIALSLKDFIMDICRFPASKRNNFIAVIIAFFPTLLLVIFAPDIFQVMLNFTAAVITIAFVFIPIAMVIRLKHDKRCHNKEGYTVSGGWPLQLTVTIIGIILLVTGLLASVGKLATLSG
ncbi:MAG: hypothetical protein OXE99_12370 [Cellvibrionales bacterium]|nr:hypothetical protein [Cellvibrionales bacterium]